MAHLSNTCVLLSVDKIAVDGTVTHFIDYNAGTDLPVYAICDDGTYAYWITNTATKKTVYKKPLTGSSAVTSDIVKMFDEIGSVSNATMEYVKDRIVMCADNKVYEFSTSASAIPTPVYTQPNSSHVYTSVAASGPAIYTSGNSGIYSSIQKYTLTTGGAMPTMTQASVAAEFPVGEVVYKIFYYLGFMMIGTSKGVRAAMVNDQDGSLAYGPLIVETTQPVYDFAARDRFVWATATIGTYDAGLIRIDLGQTIENEPLRFAWANDLQYAQTSRHDTTSVAFLGATNRLTFCTEYRTTVGYHYIEDASTLVSTG